MFLYFYCFITSLGVNGLEELISLNATFEEFVDTLFAGTSVSTDRSILSQEENERLDATIQRFLLLCLPCFPLQAVHKSLEWLIYR